MSLPDLKCVKPGHYKGSYRGVDFDVKQSKRGWSVEGEDSSSYPSEDAAVRSLMYRLDAEAVQLPPHFEDFLREQAEKVKSIALRLAPSDVEGQSDLIALKFSLGSMEKMFRSHILEFTKRLQELEERAAPVSAPKELADHE
ncbi:MAG: hypothetical protein WBX25_04250 [Rhodomicrobium sp.]